MIYQWVEESVTLPSGVIETIWRAEAGDYRLSVFRKFDKEQGRYRWLWQCAKYRPYAVGYSAGGLLGSIDGVLTNALWACQQAHDKLLVGTVPVI